MLRFDVQQKVLSIRFIKISVPIPKNFILLAFADRSSQWHIYVNINFCPWAIWGWLHLCSHFCHKVMLVLEPQIWHNLFPFCCAHLAVTTATPNWSYWV